MRASAPAKIILFGEHAVVYGRHAIVTAINLRCYVEARKSDRIRITSPLGTTGLDFEVHPYVSHAIRRFREINPIKGVEIVIDSEIPIASGLGSSAAVTVAVLKALDGEFETGLSDEEIFELARKVELDVQGIGSGTDPFIATFGGTWLIPDRKPVKLADMRLLVVNTGESSITAEMVRKVADFREKHKDVVEKIFDVIDKIALESIDALRMGNTEALSELFFLNQCMLKALGVSTSKIDDLIERLREMGVFSKITGAGGGGCIVGIGDDEALIEASEKFGGFLVEANAEGVRFE